MKQLTNDFHDGRKNKHKNCSSPLPPNNSCKGTSPHTLPLHSLTNRSGTSQGQTLQDSSAEQSSCEHTYPEQLICLFAWAPRIVTSDTAKGKPHLEDRNNNCNIQHVTGVLYPFYYSWLACQETFATYNSEEARHQVNNQRLILTNLNSLFHPGSYRMSF